MEQSSRERRVRRGRITRVVGGVVVAVSLLAGCSGSGSEGGGDAAPDTTKAEVTTTTSAVDVARLEAAEEPGGWTVLVYMAADNNLEAAAIDDLLEMTETEGTEFVVLVDRIPGYSEADLGGSLGNFEDTALLHMSDGETTVIDQPGELNMGDPDVLTEFISTGLAEYPNDHHALVLWDHGGSWSGVAWDDTDDHDNITLEELSASMAEGLEAAEVESFDLVGFDACLMSTYEVANAVAPHATYMLASEEIEPGFGWDWTAVDLPSDGLGTTELVGRIIDAYQEFSDEAGEANVTLSLLDLTKLGLLDDAAAALAGSFEEDARDVIGQLGLIRSESVAFGRDPNPERDYHLIDLGDLADRLGAVEGMAEAAAQFQEAVDGLVVDHTAGSVASGSTGIAGFFPPVADLRPEDYSDAGFSEEWASVIDAFYDQTEDIDEADRPLYTDEDRYIEDDEVELSTDGFQMSAEVGEGTGGYVSEAFVNWGRVEDGSTDFVVWYGARNATIDGDTIEADYDWRYLVIGDGATEAIVYADLHFDSDGEVDLIKVPYLYQTAAGEQADGYLQLNLAEGQIQSEMFYVRLEDGIAAITPQPGDLVLPVLKRQNLIDQSITWIPGAMNGLDAASGLGYRFTTLPAAQPIMIGLGFTGITGFTDFVYHGTATPWDL